MCILINWIIWLLNTTIYIDVKSSSYIDFDKENNKDDTKFSIGENVRISKYKSIRLFSKLV